MKILYAIQGTGNGHLSRAKEIMPLLQSEHQVDILISGSQAEVDFPFDVKFNFKGLGFYFGVNGGIDFFKTYKKNHLKDLFSEIKSLPVEDYDLVINDFEPVSAWACYLKNVYCISLSHQAAVLNKNAPLPKEIDLFGKAILKSYAPSKKQYGFHFKKYDDNIFTPVIRSEIREQNVSDDGHYTVYLPAYSDKKIIKVLKKCGPYSWQVFSKKSKEKISDEDITIHPIDNLSFIKSMASSSGVICGAGFETPAEALFLRKKLLVVPMKGQFEQMCNAAALKDMGVTVVKSFKPGNAIKIMDWIENGSVIKVDYRDQTSKIIRKILTSSVKQTSSKIKDLKENYPAKKFRKLILSKIIEQFD